MASTSALSFLSSARTTPSKAPVCSKRTVNCCAVPSHESHVNPTRRVALLGLGLASISAANLAKPDRSWALLPDDDDADLVQKAKASRQRKIQEELATEKKYANKAGFKSKGAEKVLVPVQKAVFELAKSGSQLESGDLSNLTATITGSWLSDFKSASQQISSGNAGAEKSIGLVYTAINSLTSAAQKGDVTGSKKAYVATITAFQDWASAAGVSGSLKGL